jgi:thiamine kinase-like enzyme
MERIQGETLAHAWDRLFKENSLQKVLLQLKQMIQELRALQPPPGTGVENCVGGSMIDCRLPHGTPRFGPFKTIQEFHRWLRDGFPGPKRSDELPEEEKVGKPLTEQEFSALESMVAKQEGSWPPPVFTHCDLNPFNIIVRGDQIVSIIDWEFSGWYPIYWEYTFAWLGNILRSEYRDILQSLMDPYPEELVMERTRAQWWGEW